MKRRSTAAVGGLPPSELRVFRPADWATDDASEAWNLWCDAREDWAVEHGWPSDDDARWCHEQLARPLGVRRRRNDDAGGW